MTPYSRGYAAGQEEMRRRAAETCKTFAKTGRDIAADPVERSQLRNSAALQALAADTCADYILSLPIEGEADQRGEAAQPKDASLGSQDADGSARLDRGNLSSTVKDAQRPKVPSHPQHSPHPSTFYAACSCADEGRCLHNENGPLCMQEAAAQASRAEQVAPKDGSHSVTGLPPAPAREPAEQVPGKREPWECSRCGAKINDHWTYCHCGNRRTPA